MESVKSSQPIPVVFEKEQPKKGKHGKETFSVDGSHEDTCRTDTKQSYSEKRETSITSDLVCEEIKSTEEKL